MKKYQRWKNLFSSKHKNKDKQMRNARRECNMSKF